MEMNDVGGDFFSSYRDMGFSDVRRAKTYLPRIDMEKNSGK